MQNKENLHQMNSTRSSLNENSNSSEVTKIDRVLKALRNVRETTSLNRVVSRNYGEPRKTEYLSIAPSKRQQYDDDMKKSRMLINKSSAQLRLKSRDRVPKKSGAPMWEESGLLEEDLNRFTTMFRQYYRSGRKYSFREWMSIFSDLIEELEWHQIRLLKEKILSTSRRDKTRESYQIHFSQKNPLTKIAFAEVASELRSGLCKVGCGNAPDASEASVLMRLMEKLEDARDQQLGIGNRSWVPFLGWGRIHIEVLR